MRILLVIPPFFKLFGSFNNRPNLALFTIKEVLLNKGIETLLVNLDFKEKSTLISRYEIFSNSQNIDLDQLNEANFILESKIKLFKPTHIIFSVGDTFIPSLDSGSPDITESLASIINQKFPEIFLVSYGPFIRKNKIFHLNLNGYVENIIIDLLKNKNNGFKHHIPNSIESITSPFISLKSIDYSINENDFDYIFSSRGCIYKCSFCKVHTTSNYKIIFRNPEDFVNEIDWRYRTYKIRDFYFIDSVFNYSKEHVIKICQLIKIKKIKITWRCDCRLDLFDNEMLENMIDAGCKYVKLGVEAMSSIRLSYFNKKLDFKLMQNKYNLLKKSNVGIVIYIILGNPKYSEYDYLKELEDFKSLKADKYTVSILNPLCQKNNLNSKDKLITNIFPINSHLNFYAAKFWNISESVLERYFELETSHGREDENIRVFKPFIKKTK